MADPKPGEVWIDLRPMTDRMEWKDATKFRRLVVVTEFSPHGWAEGRSSWQQNKRGSWVDLDYPPARSTRILAHVFTRRFVRDEATS